MASYIESAQKAEALKKELDALLPMKREDQDRLWQKLRLEWNYNSNHIEGNTLTYGETKLLLIFDKTTGNHELREYEEMKAHDVAVELIKEWSRDKERDLTEADIRTLNEIILVRPYWKEALTYDGQPTRREIQIGRYKEHPNSVRQQNGEMFHYASPDETPGKMADLMDWYYHQSKDLHPFQIAAEFHHKFILIHPFDDGNGRVARLVMNYILMKGGYPPIIIKSSDKKNYITALQKADAGDRTAFMEYITDQLVWSFEMEISVAKGESLEETDDIDKEFDLLKRQLKTNQFLEKTKDLKSCIQVLEETLLPFFKQVLDTFSDINDMFLDHKAYISINGYNNMSQSIDLLNLVKETDFVDWPSETPLYEVLLSLKWLGFKHSRTAGNLYSDLKIYFDDYHYKINYQFSGRTEIVKFYHESLTQEEKLYIIRELKIEVYERVKLLSLKR